MLDEGQHEASVDAWLDRLADNPSAEVLLVRFKGTFGALWARTRNTLGEVTLTAITERVLHDASRKFPTFSSLKVDSTGGIQFSELSDRPGSELGEGIRFVLVQFLTVLGNLTAEILTPELHLELSRVDLTGAASERHPAQRSQAGARDIEGEDKGS